MKKFKKFAVATNFLCYIGVGMLIQKGDLSLATLTGVLALPLTVIMIVNSWKTLDESKD